MEWYDVLRQKRLEKDISMRQVAIDNNILPDTYRRWERGEREPDIKSMIQLADYYNISLDILLARYEPKKK